MYALARSGQGERAAAVLDQRLSRRPPRSTLVAEQPWRRPPRDSPGGPFPAAACFPTIEGSRGTGRRDADRGRGSRRPAVTHAFVVGVSHYPFLDGPQMTEQGEQLGLANLSSAARSASELAGWLLNEYRCPEAPLKDVRLLLSPVDGEALNADVVARMGGQPAPATREAVKAEFTAFMEALREPGRPRPRLPGRARHPAQPAQRHRAARGLRHRRRARPAVRRHGRDRLPRRDAYLRRRRPPGLVLRRLPPAARDRPALRGPDRSVQAPGNIGLAEVAASPVFLSSSTRENAFADPQGLTIFTQALLWALRGAAAVGKDETCPAGTSPRAG